MAPIVAPHPYLLARHEIECSSPRNTRGYPVNGIAPSVWRRGSHLSAATEYGMLTASAYGASGLVPISYESAGRPEPAPASAAKDRSNCAEPSLIWDAAWACTTPTSSPTGAS
jgi:hypothetical protein